jgi:hypothetical protein
VREDQDHVKGCANVEERREVTNYVERMLQEETDLDLPAELAGRHFQRYCYGIGRAAGIVRVADSGPPGYPAATESECFTRTPEDGPPF